MTTFLNLKPDVDLLDANFQSYRLSLDPLPVLKQPLQTEPECIELSDQFYGYLHAHLASLFNHLTADPWNQEAIFYVEKGRQIKWSALSKMGNLSMIRSVWQIPSTQSSTPGNATITFADTEWAAVCDGVSNIYLLYTPSRGQGEPWQICHTYSLEQNVPLCLLLHSAHYVFPSSHQIELLVTYVIKASDIPDIEKKSAPASQKQFVCILDWITFSCPLGQENDGWHVKRLRKLLGLSVPLYAVNESSSSIILISERDFKIITDSAKPDLPSVKENMEQESVESEDKELPPVYTFIQNQEDITVKFPLEGDIGKHDVSICITPKKLEVCVCGKPLLSGPTEASLDPDQSTWTIDNSTLELHLTKTITGWWKNLVIGDKRGREEMDPALVEEVHQRLAHLTSETEVDGVSTNQGAYDPQQLEDCDVSLDQMLLQRLDGETHKATHMGNIGGYQWLFKTSKTPETLPVFCTRYDVDGVVWQPINLAGETEQFTVKHIATHPALGYVLASKVDRKFTTAAPDFSYAAVCDSVRHVYIYRQPELLNTSLELRNRRTGREVCHIAKQHVISLDMCDQILGLKAAKECIFVLGKQCLYAIKI